MSALDTLDPNRSISAMQAVNVKAPSAWFMTAMFGTAATALGAGVIASFHLSRTSAHWTIAGSVAYLASVTITAAYHVPKNDRLALVNVPAANAADVWRSFSWSWTAGNHVRTAMAIAAATCFTLAIRYRQSGLLPSAAEPLE